MRQPTIPVATDERPTSGQRADDISVTIRSMERMRRLMNKPPGAQLALPGFGEPIPFATSLACEGIESLSQEGRLVTIKELADHLTLEHSTTSRLVTEAEAKGYCLRKQDYRDRRRTTVALTPLGSRLAATSRAIRDHVVNAILADWEDADVHHLATLLGRLSDRVHDRLSALARGEVPTEIREAFMSISNTINAKTSACPVNHQQEPTPDGTTASPS